MESLLWLAQFVFCRKNKMAIKKVPHTTKVLWRKVEKIDNHTARVTQQLQHTYVEKLLNIRGLGEFYFITPDPVDILIKHIELKIGALNNLKIEFKNTHKTPARKLTDSSEMIIDELILNAISIPIMACCVLETLANKIIFDKLLFPKCHLEIQRHVPLEIKLFKILPQLKYNPTYFEKNNFKKTYEKIHKIRNNIIHQKSTSKESNETIELIKELLETDWNLIISDIKKVINDFENAPLLPSK
jgi:hypothetical protein